MDGKCANPNCDGNEFAGDSICSYPECEVVCRKCGFVSKRRTNFAYLNDSGIKKVTRLGEEPTSCSTLSAFDYDPRLDPRIFDLGRNYVGYQHLFYAHELIARPTRPLIPKTVVPFIIEAATNYYCLNPKKSFFGLGFTNKDATAICNGAAKIFKQHTQWKPTYKTSYVKNAKGKYTPVYTPILPPRGDRHTITPQRIQTYAERWVQVWSILLHNESDDLFNCKIHPYIPPELEARVRLRMIAFCGLWVKHLCAKRWDKDSNGNPLKKQNFRYSLFIRAALILEDARTSIRRVFSLTGTKQEEWYERMKHLWKYIREDYSIIKLKNDQGHVQLYWPDEPPPLSKIIKNEPKRCDLKGCLRRRWYEEDDGSCINTRHWYHKEKKAAAIRRQEYGRFQTSYRGRTSNSFYYNRQMSL